MARCASSLRGAARTLQVIVSRKIVTVLMFLAHADHKFSRPYGPALDLRQHPGVLDRDCRRLRKLSLRRDDLPICPHRHQSHPGGVHPYVQLQHTRMWIVYCGVLGRIFISPAHHQAHHSADPKHFNTTFGTCLALRD
jgi:hypothetical protein